MNAVTLSLPYPPSLNTYYRHVVIRGAGRVLISAKGRQYREDVAACLMACARYLRLEGELAVALDLYPPDNRRRDVDNAQKAILDALQHAGLFANDYQVVKLTTTRLYATRPGRVAVCVSECLTPEGSVRA